MWNSWGSVEEEVSHWRTVSKLPGLAEDFIDRHADEVDWRSISAYQVLSEAFIDKHADKLDWRLISDFQVLSEDFIIKHLDRVDSQGLLRNKQLKLSEHLRVLLLLRG